MTPALFLCLVVLVKDGDTWVCKDGTEVRSAAINTRELHGNPCPRQRPCPAMSAEDSRKVLSGLVLGKTVRCRRVGMSYRRVVAQCWHGGQDIACQMVRLGAAAWWKSYADRYGVRCD